MLQRIVSMILVCLLVLSLAGCGAGPEPEAAVPAVQTEAPAVETTEVITEPTLSAEEVLIASLPEKVKQAYDLGLVDLELLSDLDRICLGAEAAEIIQKIHVAHHGVESKIMNQILEHDHAGIEVTRYWLAQTMHMAEAEYLVEAPSDDYIENLKYMLTSQKIWDASFGYFYSGNGGVMVFDEENQAYVCDSWALPLDWEEMCDEQQGQMFIDHTYDESNLPMWVLSAYDRLTGEKIMSGSPEVPFGPREKMTVREVVETALRYNNWIPPEQVMLPHEELPTYDTTIITAELLAKETDLPEPSCQYLPESWRGVYFKGQAEGDSATGADPMLQENEIQVIKDAGFNFLRLSVDLRYFSSDAFTSYPGWLTKPKEDAMNETRLKEIDQIIAWCMERDIHVNLTITGNLVHGGGVAGWSMNTIPPVIFGNQHNAKILAREWAILARRYADIPNTYLSFTLYENPDTQQPAGRFGKFFAPVVEAIRAVTPDRCIISEITGWYAPTEDMAALGVALSCRALWPEYFRQMDNKKPEEISAFLESAVWPFEITKWSYGIGEICDANTAMAEHEHHNCDSPDDVAAVAEEYGVGFMVCGWAPNGGEYPIIRDRYNDAYMEAYLMDFAQVLSDRGYGWCYGACNNVMGLFSSYPAVEDTTYTQVDNAPLYIDNEMFGWFQTLNTMYQ